MRKRGIPEAMVRAVMCLYEDAKPRVRVGLELSEEFEMKVGVHQGCMLHVNILLAHDVLFPVLVTLDFM